MKIAKFVPMMRTQGHRVILYGPDEIECEPDEHVVISTEADRLRWGFGGPTGYDTTKPFEWDWSKPYWQETAVRAIDALRERMPAERRGHFLCLVTSTQKPIADAIAGPRWNNPIAVEWAVGYEGITGPFCAFESYAWQSHVYGLRGWRHARAFDAVIPNFFDPAHFPPVKWPTKDYLLFIGRLIDAKGPVIAEMIARRVGMPLKVAGPGATEWRKGRIEAPGLVIEGDVEYMGVVGYAERNELMANAACTLVPTKYIEPFGGVAVEAMMAGCPVVASDWGAFPELLTPAVGRTFRTPRQGAQAVREVMDLDRKKIRQHALDNYSLAAVGPRFTAWFSSLDSLWGEGFYEV
jgi:glycosyltransferase involved in cell wall biosynthesis